MYFLQCITVIQNICFGKWVLSVRNQVSSIWSCRIRYKPFVYDQVCEWRGLYYHKFITGGDSFPAGMYEAMSGESSFGIKQQSCELINKLKREKKKVQSNEELFIRKKNLSLDVDNYVSEQFTKKANYSGWFLWMMGWKWSRNTCCCHLLIHWGPSSNAKSH